MRGVALMTLVAVTGCGAGATRSEVSARFAERTVYRSRGTSFAETIRGAFDWKTKKGWAVERAARVETRLVQLGKRCYRRYPGQQWKRSSAYDADGLCDPGVLRDPATEDDLVRSVASNWESLGPASVSGIRTTHYRGRLNVGAVKGPIDLWVDGDGVVRREEQRSEGGFVSVLEYFDLGIDVQVQPPRLGPAG